MDIKDSYLHGTVGVVKSINVDGDKIKYTLADVANTTKTVALPLATTTNNGLAPKVINTNTATVNSSYYVLASTNGSAAPSWYKLPANSFSNDDTKVTQTNTTTSASYRVLLSGNANDTTETTTARKSANLLFDPSTGTLSSTYINTKGLKGQAESLEDLMKSGMALTYHRFSKPSFSNETGITVSGNANGVIWVGTHGPEASNTSDIGYGHMLGFVGGNGALYHKVVVNGDITKAWKQIAYTTSNITGNAASADKLKTSRKLWGLDFDGSADVSGNMTGVGNVTMNGDILINSENNDRYLIFSYANLDRHSWRLGYLGTGIDAANYFVLQGTKTATGGNYTNALYFNNSNFNATFAAAVTATSFIGNLDGTYVNKLTGYSKATSASNIVSTDTLNTALGKLEYKADWACDWITSVTADDTDTLVNKWGEIVDFLDSVKEGTDITDEFVTRKTELTIIAYKHFKNRVKIAGESTSLYLDSTSSLNTVLFSIMKTDATEATRSYLIMRDDSVFKIANHNWNVEHLLLHEGNTHIKNGVITIAGKTITPITSLANYVTLDTALTITGEKTFTNSIVIPNKGSNALSGMTNASIMYDSYTSLNSTGYHPILGVKTNGGNVVNLGAYINGVGFYGYKNGRTENGWDWKFVFDSVNGNLETTGDITLHTASGDSPALIFQRGRLGTDSSVDWRMYVSDGKFLLQKTSGTTDAPGAWTNVLNFNTGSNNDNKILTSSYSITAPSFKGNLTGNVTGNVSGSATYLPITQINNESEISNSGIRGYLGSGTGWTGENNMGYSAILSVGNASRGFRLWSGKGDAGCLNYYIGNQNGNAWVSARKILDSNNYNGYAPTLTGIGASGTWNISISGASAKLTSTQIVSTTSITLDNTGWINTGYTFANLETGTYAIQLTSGSNLVASGIMSVCKNLSDTIGDEIPLHVQSTAGWRPYLRTYQNKLLISSNDASATSRTVTIKIAQIL